MRSTRSNRASASSDRSCACRSCRSDSKGSSECCIIPGIGLAGGTSASHSGRRSCWKVKTTWPWRDESRRRSSRCSRYQPTDRLAHPMPPLDGGWPCCSHSWLFKLSLPFRTRTRSCSSSHRPPLAWMIAGNSIGVNRSLECCPARDLEVAVLAAVRVDIDGDRLVAWTRRIEE